MQMSFKILALAPQIFMRDALGHEVFYIHQKLFKLKEDVRVYSDSSKTREMYHIGADRIIDISARYNFTDSMNGIPLGSIKREGLKSLWKASYNIFNDTGNPSHHIKEDKPVIKVFDALLGEVPVLGMFSGYFFNPSYTIYQVGTEIPVLQISKQRAFFEGKFEIVKMMETANEAEERRLLLSIMMMTLLERSRG